MVSGFWASCISYTLYILKKLLKKVRPRRPLIISQKISFIKILSPIAIKQIALRVCIAVGVWFQMKCKYSSVFLCCLLTFLNFHFLNHKQLKIIYNFFLLSCLFFVWYYTSPIDNTSSHITAILAA